MKLKSRQRFILHSQCLAKRKEKCQTSQHKHNSCALCWLITGSVHWTVKRVSGVRFAGASIMLQSVQILSLDPSFFIPFSIFFHLMQFPNVPFEKFTSQEASVAFHTHKTLFSSVDSLMSF